MPDVTLPSLPAFTPPTIAIALLKLPKLPELLMPALPDLPGITLPALPAFTPPSIAIALPKLRSCRRCGAQLAGVPA